MSTPKIDRIIVEFSNRITQPVTCSGATFTKGPNVVLDEADYMSYVNKAMFVLFNTYWKATEGDKVKFLELFPELLKPVDLSIKTDLTDHYLDVSGIRNMKCLVHGIKDNTIFVDSPPNHDYAYYRSSRFPQYNANESKPVVFLLDGDTSAKLMPTDLSGTSIELFYIVYPTQPDGNFLTRNGSYDSPFSQQWNSDIAEFAEKLYRKDMQYE